MRIQRSELTLPGARQTLISADHDFGLSAWHLLRIITWHQSHVTSLWRLHTVLPALSLGEKTGDCRSSRKSQEDSICVKWTFHYIVFLWTNWTLLEEQHVPAGCQRSHGLRRWTVMCGNASCNLPPEAAKTAKKYGVFGGCNWKKVCILLKKSSFMLWEGQASKLA